MTTATDVEGVEIVGIEGRSRWTRVMGMRVMTPGETFIRTRMRGEPLKAEVIDR
jgi:hypothetical protein